MRMIKLHDCVLAIDAGGTFLKAALIDTVGIIKKSFLMVPIKSDGSIVDIQYAFSNLISQEIQRAKENNRKLTGIGISIPGPFDYSEGISRMEHKFAAIYGIPLRSWLEELAGNISIDFVHDSTAFILGATWNKDYSCYKKIAGVIIGTGLGFASTFDSKVFMNADKGPGISIYDRKYRDKTAEDYVSRRGIINLYKEITMTDDKAIDVIDIANLAHAGQHQAIETFERTGVHLAEILYPVMVENHFEVLLLGGAISKSSDLFINTLKEGLSDVSTLKTIEQIHDVDNTPLLGAARALSL